MIRFRLSLDRHDWPILGVFVLGLVLVSLTSWLPSVVPWGFVSGEVFGSVVEALGIAFMVAGVLAVTVDQYFRQRTTQAVDRSIEAVAEGVGPYYIAYGLPEEVAWEVMFLKQIDVLRKEYTVRYEFEHSERRGYLKVRQWLKYSIANYSDRSITHRYRLAPGGEPGERRIMWVRGWGGDLGDGFEDDFVDVGGSMEPYTKEVEIPHNGDNPQNWVEAHLEGEVEINDSDVIFLGPEATLNAEVAITKPPDVDVEIVFGHRKNDQALAVGEHGRRLNAVLLPFAAIGVEWGEKESPATAGGAS